MAYDTEKELHEISKSLVELNRSCVAINSTLNMLMTRLIEGAKKEVEMIKDENGWIKINSKDDCPRTHEPVLIRCELGESAWWFGEYHVATYSFAEYWNTERYDDIENELSVRVTHWRPIPKL